MYSIAQAQSLEDCKLVNKDSVPVGFQTTGFVSLQGHYASELDLSLINYPYALVCDDRLVLDRADRASTFNFSDPTSVVANVGGNDVYGGGHITTTGVGVNFQTEAYHGFTEGACEVKHVSDGCASSDVCVLKTSNEDQGTVADCNNNTMPYLNDFQYKICCTPTEYCRDGIDNTGDGLIDCASPDCHPNEALGTVPQRCDPLGSPGNNQTTLDCVIGGSPESPIFSDHCVYTDGLGIDHSFYCSYGELDNSSNPPGFCCPEGQWYNEAEGDCEDFTKCGIGAETWCGFNFNDNRANWLGELFSGSGDWCHSRLPLFRDTAGRSEACCPIMHQGTYGYYIVDENVKIFGHE